jgi:hypothetical protein
VTTPTDRALVERVLGLLPTNNYEAAKVLQVAEGTIRRWRIKAPATLRAETRRAILSYLQAAGDEGADPSRSRRPSAGHPDEELRSRLDAIEAQELDEWTKTWKISEVAAAYRTKALADLAVALRQESRAAELRGEAALTRARSGREDREGARLRSLIEEAVETNHVPTELIQGKALPFGEEAGAAKAPEPD